jgi:hypothetical protein
VLVPEKESERDREREERNLGSAVGATVRERTGRRREGEEWRLARMRERGDREIHGETGRVGLWMCGCSGCVKKIKNKIKGYFR